MLCLFRLSLAKRANLRVSKKVSEKYFKNYKIIALIVLILSNKVFVSACVNQDVLAFDDCMAIYAAELSKKSFYKRSQLVRKMRRHKLSADYSNRGKIVHMPTERVPFYKYTSLGKDVKIASKNKGSRFGRK